MTTIDKKTLEHLASLARIELDPSQEDKLAADLGAILAHFEELKALPPRPASALHVTRYTLHPLRDDAATLPDHFTDQHRLIEAFPDKENGFLKIPPIFE